MTESKDVRESTEAKQIAQGREFNMSRREGVRRLKPERGSVTSPVHREAEAVGDSHPTSALPGRPKQRGYRTLPSRAP